MGDLLESGEVFKEGKGLERERGEEGRKNMGKKASEERWNWSRLVELKALGRVGETGQMCIEI